MATVHWLGAGLSSVPGIRRLVSDGYDLVLWNRTLSKAEAALAGLEDKATARAFDWDQLANETQAGDVVVSMLPAAMHIKVATLCLQKKAHFVSSSYLSPEMNAMHDSAEAAGLCFVNEVGLDPGLDHLLAHALMDEYKTSDQFDKSHFHRFRSYCGGVPKFENEFRYKFSWSPLGVLRALTNRARWLDNGETKTSDRPWKSLTQYEARLPNGNESFQAYPNRDSLPFMTAYGFQDDWNMDVFVRGTLRLNGWAEAWSEIFDPVESSEGEAGEQRLIKKSEELWNHFQYGVAEPDRVVLCVELEASDGAQTRWHRMYCLDQSGNSSGSAMSRLVSLTTSIAVEAVLNGGIGSGVSAAPNQMDLVRQWLDKMTELGETFEKTVVV